MRKNTDQEVNKKIISISYISQFFQYGIAILVLPVILNKLNAEELGVWYIFLSITSLVKLLDFGFAPSIQRNIAYVAAGAQELKKDGYDEIKGSFINDSLMASLIQTSKYIYRRIGICILILSLIAGPFYLYYSLDDYFTCRILTIWIFYSFSLAFDFYFTYILSVLKGMGLINEYNLNIIISKIVYMTILYTMVILGYGLVSLVVATFVNLTIMIFLGLYDLYKKVDGFSEWFNAKEFDNLFSILWKNARNSGIVSIGVFLLSQAGVLISGFYLKIPEVAQLGLVLQLYGILVVVSRVYLTTYTPKLSSLWVGNNIVTIRRIFVRCQLIGYLTFFSGTAVIYFFGDIILKDIIHSRVLLPTGTVILLYALFNFMELTHGNCCSLISTSNNIPFVKASVASGIISICCTLIFLESDFGMVSFPLGLVCGSLPYNAWKWPMVTYRMLKTN